MTKRDEIAKPYDWSPMVWVQLQCKGCGAQRLVWTNAIGSLVADWFRRSAAHDGWLVIGRDMVNAEVLCPECSERCADTPMVRAARREREALQIVRVE